jgi:hypothetical protein
MLIARTRTILSAPPVARRCGSVGWRCAVSTGSPPCHAICTVSTFMRWKVGERGCEEGGRVRREHTQCRTEAFWRQKKMPGPTLSYAAAGGGCAAGHSAALAQAAMPQLTRKMRHNIS